MSLDFTSATASAAAGLPAGLTPFEITDGGVLASGAIAWDISLVPGLTRIVHYGLTWPDQTASPSFTASVSASAAFASTPMLDLPTLTAPLRSAVKITDDLMAALAALPVVTADDTTHRDTAKTLVTAVRDRVVLTQKEVSQNLTDLLTAISELQLISSPDLRLTTHDLRLEADRLLKYWQFKMTVASPAPEYITEALTAAGEGATLTASLPVGDFDKSQSQGQLAKKWETLKVKIDAGDLPGAIAFLKTDLIPFIEAHVTAPDSRFSLLELAYEALVWLEHQGLLSIAVLPSSVTLLPGESEDFSLSCFFADGTTAMGCEVALPVVRWSLDPPKGLGAITSTGVFVAGSPGSGSIMAGLFDNGTTAAVVVAFPQGISGISRFTFPGFLDFAGLHGLSDSFGDGVISSQWAKFTSGGVVSETDRLTLDTLLTKPGSQRSVGLISVQGFPPQDFDLRLDLQFSVMKGEVAVVFGTMGTDGSSAQIIISQRLLPSGDLAQAIAFSVKPTAAAATTTIVDPAVIPKNALLQLRLHSDIPARSISAVVRTPSGTLFERNVPDFVPVSPQKVLIAALTGDLSSNGPVHMASQATVEVFGLASSLQATPGAAYDASATPLAFDAVSYSDLPGGVGPGSSSGAVYVMPLPNLSGATRTNVSSDLTPVDADGLRDYDALLVSFSSGERATVYTPLTPREVKNVFATEGQEVTVDVKVKGVFAAQGFGDSYAWSLTDAAVTFPPYVTVPAVITGVSPGTAPPGKEVTISGHGFEVYRGDSTVTVGGVAAEVVSWSAEKIVVLVPVGVVTGELVVSLGGVVSNSVIFQVPNPYVVKLVGSGSSFFGEEVTALGDVNGDGREDLGIPSWNESGTGLTHNGAVRIFLGGGATSATLSISDAASVIYGSQNLEHFGTSLAGGGDYNGDGFSDFAVKSSPIDRIDIFLGRSNLPAQVASVEAEISLIPSGGAAGLGWPIRWCDLNSDGLSDLVVGGVGSPRVQAFLGDPTNLPGQATRRIASDHADLTVVAQQFECTGNVSGDESSDLLVTRIDPVSGRQSLYFFLGPLSAGALNLENADARFMTARNGTAEGADLSSLAIVGDINGDSYDDLVVDRDDNRALILFGRSVLPALMDLDDVDVEIAGEAGYIPAADLSFPASAGFIGDLNGDGIEDLGLTEPLSDKAGQDFGAAYIFLGRPLWPRTLSGTDASVIVVGDNSSTSFGAPSSRMFGLTSICSMDIDNNGRRDLFVGAPRDPTGGVDAGAVFGFLFQ